MTGLEHRMVSYKKYKLGYVDEDESDVRSFYKYIKPYEDTILFEVFTPKKLIDIEEFYKKIKESDLDILVIDYRLNEYTNIDFLGSDLIHYVHKHRRDFPCILLTSHPDEAIDNFENVHLVYDKSVIYDSNEENKRRFYRILISAIEKYINDIRGAHDIIHEFNQKSVLDLEEENQYIKADEFIEANLDGVFTVPRQLKSQLHNQELKKLINEVQELLEKIEEYVPPNQKKDT